jgi:hypothetical protein
MSDPYTTSLAARLRMADFLTRDLAPDDPEQSAAALEVSHRTGVALWVVMLLGVKAFPPAAPRDPHTARLEELLRPNTKRR